MGVPGATVSGLDLAGEVSVILGSSTGLTPWASQLWIQDVGTVLGAPEEGDRFGHALVAGDFNNNGFVDLAIGVPGEAIGSLLGAGLVNILQGSNDGLTDPKIKLGLSNVFNKASASYSFIIHHRIFILLAIIFIVKRIHWPKVHLQ